MVINCGYYFIVIYLDFGGSCGQTAGTPRKKKKCSEKTLTEGIFPSFFCGKTKQITV